MNPEDDPKIKAFRLELEARKRRQQQEEAQKAALKAKQNLSLRSTRKMSRNVGNQTLRTESKPGPRKRFWHFWK